MNLAALHNGKALANYRHVAFVEITEGRRRCFSRQASGNQPSCVSSFLHRYLGHAGQRLAVLLSRRRIADHKNLRMSGHGEIGLNLDASRAIGSTPSHLPAGDGATPAVQITVLLAI